jgi:RHS repeat-associated protein
MDYYPYGATRIATSTYPTNEKRQYIGQPYDQGSGLNYLNARYYNSQQGQFVSQDPSFLAVGDPAKVSAVTNMDQSSFLSDPQLANSYAYSRDNPIIRKDPQGNFLLPAIGAVLMVYGFSQMLVDTYDWYNMNIRYKNGSSDVEKQSTGFKVSFDAITFFTGQGLERAGYQVTSMTVDSMFAAHDAIDTFGGSIYGASARMANGFISPVIQQSQTPQQIWAPLSPLTFMSYSAIPADTHTACGLLCVPATSNSQTSKQNSSGATTPSTSSGGGGGSSGGYGSSGTVYTNYGPANGHSACGTLCQ